MALNENQLMTQAALDYARRGWPVVAVHPVLAHGGCGCGRPDCSSPGKHPRASRGFHDATLDSAAIERAFLRASNCGVATGESAGLWVLDIDRAPGEQALAALVGRYGPLTATVESVTGGGGRHLFFRYPAGTSGPNVCGHLGRRPGHQVERRRCCGTTVAPPLRRAISMGIGSVPVRNRPRRRSGMAAWPTRRVAFIAARGAAGRTNVVGRSRPCSGRLRGERFGWRGPPRHAGARGHPQPFPQCGRGKARQLGRIPAFWTGGGWRLNSAGQVWRPVLTGPQLRRRSGRDWNTAYAIPGTCPTSLRIRRPSAGPPTTRRRPRGAGACKRPERVNDFETPGGLI